MARQPKREQVEAEKPECFLIMPISDPDGYDKGHFRRVASDIFGVACDLAGYQAIRADDVAATGLIHLDVLQKLLECPMAICDLSTRNPNVLFELGLRQAFDKPVVLVQQVGTEKIFDIAPLKYTEYRHALLYREVREDQRSIARALRATASMKEKGRGVNSIVKLLSLTQPATIPETKKTEQDELLQLVRAEIGQLRPRCATSNGA